MVLLDGLREKRWASLACANLRILIGFAFVPAGLKKLLGQPFTDPANSGAFHDFLDAFYATGPFYHFVGAVQLVIAALLMTQVLAALGAAMALPVLSAIMVFCWSTAGTPTSVVVTLMFLGTVALLLWDYEKWIPVIGLSRAGKPTPHPISGRWRNCGAAILLFYFATCIINGGVYRPKGFEPNNPAFYALPLIALFPVVTLLLELRQKKTVSRAAD